MSAAEGKFSDLTARFLSAVVLVLVGGAALWAGGAWFLAFTAIAAGAMVWEAARMADPQMGVFEIPALGLAAAICLPIAASQPDPLHVALALVVCCVGLGIAVGGQGGAIVGVVAGLLLAALLVRLGGSATGAVMYWARLLWLAVPAMLGLAFATRAEGRRLVAGFAAYIMVAGFGLVALRAGGGLVWALWLVAVVVVSDVAGYFAGRLIGGPRFWPRVSPKKTWSGTLAGWIGGAALGAAFMGPTGAGAGLILLSVLAAMAAQAGDIVESALKRKVGVKDASNLIPGHGGVFDRFDGMLGAALLAMVVGVATGLPPGFAAP